MLIRKRHEPGAAYGIFLYSGLVHIAPQLTIYGVIIFRTYCKHYNTADSLVWISRAGDLDGLSGTIIVASWFWVHTFCGLLDLQYRKELIHALSPIQSARIADPQSCWPRTCFGMLMLVYKWPHLPSLAQPNPCASELRNKKHILLFSRDRHYGSLQ